MYTPSILSDSDRSDLAENNRIRLRSLYRNVTENQDKLLCDSFVEDQIWTIRNNRGQNVPKSKRVENLLGPTTYNNGQLPRKKVTLHLSFVKDQSPLLVT